MKRGTEKRIELKVAKVTIKGYTGLAIYYGDLPVWVSPLSKEEYVHVSGRLAEWYVQALINEGKSIALAREELVGKGWVKVIEGRLSFLLRTLGFTGDKVFVKGLWQVCEACERLAVACEETFVELEEVPEYAKYNDSDGYRAILAEVASWGESGESAYEFDGGVLVVKRGVKVSNAFYKNRDDVLTVFLGSKNEKAVLFPEDEDGFNYKTFARKELFPGRYVVKFLEGKKVVSAPSKEQVEIFLSRLG